MKPVLKIVGMFLCKTSSDIIYLEPACVLWKTFPIWQWFAYYLTCQTCTGMQCLTQFAEIRHIKYFNNDASLQFVYYKMLRDFYWNNSLKNLQNSVLQYNKIIYILSFTVVVLSLFPQNDQMQRLFFLFMLIDLVRFAFCRSFLYMRWSTDFLKKFPSDFYFSQ